jgi:CheY-like chemotaxis protein
LLLSKARPCNLLGVVGKVLLHPHSSRSFKLLLVEDNPADVLLLKIVFQEVGLNCRIEVRTDGEKAVHYLVSHAPIRESRPDLVLLDLNLPRMDGHEVLKFIKADPGMRLIPVVILSSSKAPADISSAYREGASSYLLKPNDIDETFNLVRTIGQYWMNLAVLPMSV